MNDHQLKFELSDGQFNVFDAAIMTDGERYEGHFIGYVYNCEELDGWCFRPVGGALAFDTIAMRQIADFLEAKNKEST